MHLAPLPLTKASAQISVNMIKNDRKDVIVFEIVVLNIPAPDPIR